MTLLTILVSHLEPEGVEAGRAHLDRMGFGDRVVLCHGGRREVFEAIDMEEKIFLEDEGLRGPPALRQSYTEALTEVHRQYVAADPDVTEVLVLEFDQIPLAPGFPERLVALLDESAADFAGKGCTDRTATNWWHRVRYRDDPELLALLRSISVREDTDRIFGCLGSGFVMRRAVLDAFAAVDHLDGVYAELYVPTVVHHLGFRVQDVDRVSDLYDHVRWTPGYSIDEALALRDGGALVVHPLKAIDQLERLRP